jgi:uncharacterized protein (DUF302 family)
VKKLLTIICLLSLSSLSFAGGIVSKTSAHSVKDTLDKLEAIVTSKGFTVVARVNHAKAAEKSGQSLNPTEVLIFGNPKVGTALMKSNQSIGLDLPIKVVAWEDDKGVVTIAYNDPTWMVMRHGIKDRDEVVTKMTGALRKFTDAAAN